MSKSFKFKNNMYLDSTSIVHGNRKLNEILDKMQIKTKEVSGNTGEYGNVNLGLDISKYVILEMLVTSISGAAQGSPMAIRIGIGASHYAHIVTDYNTFTLVQNKNVTIKVYYIEI